MTSTIIIFFRKLQQNNGLIVQWTRHGGQSVWKCGRCVRICSDSQSWRGKISWDWNAFLLCNKVYLLQKLNKFANTKDWTWVQKIFINCALSSWVNHWTLQVWFGASHDSVVMRNYSFRLLDMFPRLYRHWFNVTFLILSKSLSEAFGKKIWMKDRLNVHVHCTDLNEPTLTNLCRLLQCRLRSSCFSTSFNVCGLQSLCLSPCYSVRSHMCQLDSIVVSLFGNMTVDTREILINALSSVNNSSLWSRSHRNCVS